MKKNNKKLWFLSKINSNSGKKELYNQLKHVEEIQNIHYFIILMQPDKDMKIENCWI